MQELKTMTQTDTSQTLAAVNSLTNVKSDVSLPVSGISMYNNDTNSLDIEKLNMDNVIPNNNSSSSTFSPNSLTGKYTGSDNTLNGNANNSTRKRSASDFKFLECIGEGSYSKVYRAVSKRNVHLIYAIKILNKQHIHKEKKRKYVSIEKDTLNMLGKHPGIVTLYYTFQDPKSLYFVIDFAHNGELLTLIHNLGSLSMELARYYTVQLIDTIKFIHSKGIVHRDLKPENILLNNEWKLMITDFGAAKILDQDNISSSPRSASVSPTESETQLNEQANEESGGSFVGTAEYIPPELLRYNQSGFPSDYWSLGCIIYQMFVGKPPFKASTEYETFERIVEVNYSFPDPHKYPIPSAVIDIIRQLLLEDPQQRLNGTRIQNHQWFKNVDWNNKEKIWGTVPKLECYKPENYFKFKDTKSVKTIPSNISSSYGLQTTESKRVDVDYENDKPSTVLKKQIHNAQSNNHLMNKVLNNRLNEKNGEITKKLIETNSVVAPVTKRNTASPQSQKPVSQPVKILTNKSKYVYTTPPTTVSSSSSSTSSQKVFIKTNKQRISSVKTNNMSPTISNDSVKQSVSTKFNRNSQTSLSSLFTSNDSSKSVIIHKQSTTPTLPPSAIVPSNTVKAETPIKPLSSNKSQVNIPTKPKTQAKTQVKASVQNTTKSNTKSQLNIQKSVTKQNKILASGKPTSSPISSPKNTTYTLSGTRPNQQQILIPKPRVASSDAAAAAGAIGTLLTHKRHLNSTSSTSTQYKQLHNHQKQLINPVLLDRQIPSIITSKLMLNETILKLDNIFKSEISHKPNQFVANGQALNHTILEDIIHKFDRVLEKNLKACIMVVTSNARFFIYELNDDFKLRNPQSSTQMQALDFYSKITEVKLTNKYVSLYDYEFDEELHDGYLILELSNLNKLIFLSPWDRGKFVKGGLNSNVRVGFHVNENDSWVNSFLKAKNLLKKKELTNQKTTKPREISESNSSVHNSFRKLKLNTQRIRSFSQSSGARSSASSASSKNLKLASSKTSAQSNPPSSTLPASPSMPSFSSTETRKSINGSNHGSLLNGMKSLSINMRGKRVRSDSSATTSPGFDKYLDEYILGGETNDYLEDVNNIHKLENPATQGQLHLKTKELKKA